MKEFDEIKLKDGRTGFILEVFDKWDDYLVEFATPNGEHLYDQEFISRDEIECVIR